VAPAPVPMVIVVGGFVMRLRKLAMVLGVGLLLVGAAAAQQPRQPGGGFGGFGGFGSGGLANLLGTTPQLQTELKMDKEQVEKVTAALTKVREEMRDETAKLRDRNTTAEQRTEITKKVTEANNKALESILKPEQLKRFRQIENQQAGMGIYAKEDVQKTLKMSDDQKDKITTITTDLSKDLRDLAGGGRGRPDPDAQKKRESLQNEAKESIAKLLSAEQKEALKDLTGEPFDMPRPNFGGGAGGFGGFGGGTPGTVLSNGTQAQLRLTDEQKKELEALQKEVDSKLEKLLTEEQRTQLKQMRENAGRGGFGGGAGGGTGGRPGGRPQRPNNPPQ
jgi:Spy/CpxP family protein refolding chaperone